MATWQDKFIFVTGVVGRAMGSGTFGSSQIQELTKAACDAFDAQFGAPQAPVAAHHAPQQRPAQAPASQAHSDIPMQKGCSPEEFGSWSGQKAYYGKKEWEAWGQPWPEVTWGTLLDKACADDQKAVKALTKMAEGVPQPGEWYQANCRKILRARAVLKMAAQMRSTGGPPPQQDETPF